MCPVFTIRCQGVLLDPQELCPDLGPCQPERARPLPSGWVSAVSAPKLPAWPWPHPPRWPPLRHKHLSQDFRRIKISSRDRQKQLQAVWPALCLPPPLPKSRRG